MKFVLALSVGPVGGFIAGGRRSRDLWYASTWLSETTRHVAECLARGAHANVSAELMLPTRQRLDALKQADRRTHGRGSERVSNKVLALVDATRAADAQAALRTLAQECRQQARAFLLGELKKLLEDRRLERIIDREALTLQMSAIERGDFLEFSAAWAPLKGADPFGGAVSRACDLRDATPKLFRHPAFSRPGVARSDLDEGRDSVLRADDAALRVERAKAGLIESEELDAIGLLRRAGPYLLRQSGEQRLRPLPFRPTPNVAAAPWLEGASQHPDAARALRGLRDVLQRAADRPDDDFFVWGSTAHCPAVETGADFPFEAGLLFENGCEALLSSIERLERPRGRGNLQAPPSEEWRGAAEARRALLDAKHHVRQLHRHVGPPIPYYAFLKLDGDKIGATLKAQASRADYDRLVGALDGFARQAAEAVERSHGTAFYVAGDELAAYVPLDRALPLVAEIAALLRTTLSQGRFEGVTASASVVFAHFKDDLRGVRSTAQRALKHAKARNGGHLCVFEMPRAGADRWVCGPLEPAAGRPHSLVTELDALADAVASGAISLRTEQHLRDHFERFGGPVPPEGAYRPFGQAASPLPDASSAPLPGVRLAQDAVRRQLERSGRAEHVVLAERIDTLTSWHDVLALADQIRIASRIADVRRQRRAS